MENELPRKHKIQDKQIQEEKKTKIYEENTNKNIEKPRNKKWKTWK